MFKLLSIITLLCLLSVSGIAQKCDKVMFTGKVIDTIQPQSFYNLMIVNRTTGKGVFGQPNGSFSVYVSNGDTLSISVKEYSMINFVVIADSNCQFRKRIVIDRKPKELKEIVVKPLKSLEQIKEEREALAMRETRMVTGIEMLQSPITALYQTFSKKEQNKRWIAEQEFKDNQRKVVRELLRTYVAYEIINLSEDEFDQFISFLNVNESFLKTATEMELITFIQDKFEHFKLINIKK
jgi:tyrosyl-tRNA synthetase